MHTACWARLACSGAAQWFLLKAAWARIIAATMTRPLVLKPARLVLLVGATLRIDDSLSQTLAREGLRCLWLAGVQQALDAARLAAPVPTQFADWSLDTHGGCLSGRGRRVELTLLQGALMHCLVQAAGRVVSHAQLTAARSHQRSRQ